MRRIRGFRGLRTVLAVAAVVTAVLAFSVAVASSTVPGHPVPGMTPPDFSKIIVGPYPSGPIEYSPTYGVATDVYQIESRRMLSYLAGPDEIDPDVTFLGGARVLDTSDANFDDSDGPFPKSWQPIAERNRMIAGAYIWRDNNSVRARKHITLAIMRFPTEQAAQAAVDGFSDALAAPGLHPIPIDGVENARASSITDAKGQVFAVHGVYAIIGHAVIPRADPAALGERLKAMLQTQLVRMADLKPTPLEDIPDLPTNPDNILGLTLPNKYDSSDSDRVGWSYGGVYSPAGALHFERDGAAARKAYAAAGVDLVARNAATVYRTRDLAAAFGLQAALTTLGRDDDEYPHPPGITDAHCIQLDEPEPIRDYTYLCAVVYGRYVAVIGAEARFSGAAPASFAQRVSAQYSMLAKSG
ncbi:DUF7373 family lipoprotein [Nocardia aurantiaca]|uniref:Uncharacterized protein n=1 Tax=Nocardia aurantiaca TaxID=2675850 RepID=A0A6I3KWV0_9NOCA|nr:hypothetical protein [Nocardia aurantiaca]MTE13000.1 hypothetical protein [Nocardia aurantiaca]